jgi:hypothetical protein
VLLQRLLAIPSATSPRFASNDTRFSTRTGTCSPQPQPPHDSFERNAVLQWYGAVVASSFRQYHPDNPQSNFGAATT